MTKATPPITERSTRLRISVGNATTNRVESHVTRSSRSKGALSVQTTEDFHPPKSVTYNDNKSMKELMQILFEDLVSIIEKSDLVEQAFKEYRNNARVGAVTISTIRRNIRRDDYSTPNELVTDIFNILDGILSYSNGLEECTSFINSLKSNVNEKARAISVKNSPSPKKALNKQTSKTSTCSGSAPIFPSTHSEANDLNNILQFIEKDDARSMSHILKINTNLTKLYKKVTHHGSKFAWTALHMAACYGKTDCAVTLLKYNADIEAQDTWHNSRPLGWAANKGHAELCRIFINSYGADQYARNALNYTAFDLVINKTDRVWRNVFDEAKNLPSTKNDQIASPDNDSSFPANNPSIKLFIKRRELAPTFSQQVQSKQTNIHSSASPPPGPQKVYPHSVKISTNSSFALPTNNIVGPDRPSLKLRVSKERLRAHVGPTQKTSPDNSFSQSQSVNSATSVQERSQGSSPFKIILRSKKPVNERIDDSQYQDSNLMKNSVNDQLNSTSVLNYPNDTSHAGGPSPTLQNDANTTNASLQSRFVYNAENQTSSNNMATHRVNDKTQNPDSMQVEHYNMSSYDSHSSKQNENRYSQDAPIESASFQHTETPPTSQQYPISNISHTNASYNSLQNSIQFQNYSDGHKYQPPKAVQHTPPVYSISTANLYQDRSLFLCETINPSISAISTKKFVDALKAVGRTLVVSVGIVSDRDMVKIVIPINGPDLWTGKSINFGSNVRSISVRLLIADFDVLSSHIKEKSPEFDFGNTRPSYNISATQITKHSVSNADTMINAQSYIRFKALPLVSNGPYIHDCCVVLELGLNKLEFSVVAAIPESLYVVSQKIELFILKS